LKDRFRGHETEAGLLILIRRSKGDQEATGAVVAVPYGTDLCPVAAVRNWLQYPLVLRAVPSPCVR
jgi:hypothetical protein